MQAKRLTYFLAALLPLGFAGQLPIQAQQSTSSCQELSPDLVTRLTRFTQLRFRLQTTPRLEIVEKRPDCYYKVAFVVVGGDKPFRKTAYISPDRKHLSSELVDVDGDPDAAIQNDEARTKKIVAAGAQLIHGSDNAPVQLVIYADLQCPYCARFWTEVLRPYISTNDPAVAVFYRSYPLERQHPWARIASVVSKCSELQGQSYFIGLADKIYANQRTITLDNIVGFASSYLETQANFDMNQFRACLSSGQVDSAIQADITSGQQIELSAIPTIFINGARFRGAPNAQQFAAVIESAKRSSGSGVRIPSPGNTADNSHRDVEAQLNCSPHNASRRCEKQ